MYSGNRGIEKISQYRHMVDQISKLHFLKIGGLMLRVSCIFIALMALVFSVV